MRSQKARRGSSSLFRGYPIFSKWRVSHPNHGIINSQRFLIEIYFIWLVKWEFLLDTVHLVPLFIAMSHAVTWWKGTFSDTTPNGMCIDIFYRLFFVPSKKWESSTQDWHYSEINNSKRLWRLLDWPKNRITITNICLENGRESVLIGVACPFPIKNTLAWVI